MKMTEKCTVPDCPWGGYTDTKKCWHHSLGLEGSPPPRENFETISGPMTFEEAKKAEKEENE